MAQPRAGQSPAEAEPPEPAEADASQSPSQSESAAAGSSPASSAAGKPGAGPFFTDPGTFDADREAEHADEPPPAPPAPEQLVVWTPERIRRILVLQGNATHALVGVAQTDWVWLDAELDMVCGPLSDYANRVPQLAAIAHLSDDAAVAMGFGSYLFRSWRERVRELQRRQTEPPPPAMPVTGRAPGDDEPIPQSEVPPAWTTQ